jgi:hypothetical protein
MDDDRGRRGLAVAPRLVGQPGDEGDDSRGAHSGVTLLRGTTGFASREESRRQVLRLPLLVQSGSPAVTLAVAAEQFTAVVKRAPGAPMR